MRRECRERFPRHRIQRKPLVNDPGMHHGTCVTHVPWCMSGSLTRGGGENVPGIPGACATRNSTYLAKGPWDGVSLSTLSHGDKITCVTFSPDSRHVVTGCADRALRVWEVDGGLLTQVGWLITRITLFMNSSKSVIKISSFQYHGCQCVVQSYMPW